MSSGYQPVIVLTDLGIERLKDRIPLSDQDDRILLEFGQEVHVGDNGTVTFQLESQEFTLGQSAYVAVIRDHVRRE